jgi:hypothetical protein
MIRNARLVLVLALAAGCLTVPHVAFAQAPDDGSDEWVICDAGEPCSDADDSGGDPGECAPDDELCDDGQDDVGDEGGDWADEPTLPAQVKRPARPVKVKRAKVTLAAVCEPEEGCVAATYTLKVKGQKLTATDEALDAGQTTKLVFKLTRKQVRKLGKRAVKATVTAPGLPAARITLRA